MSADRADEAPVTLRTWVAVAGSLLGAFMAVLDIMIANASLADRRITGTFYVKRADQIVDQMRSALDARIVRLPGDVVVVT